MLGRLIANLGGSAVSAQERAALEAILASPRRVAAEVELVTEGEAATECHLLVEGQAFRHKTTPDGRRQITAFLAPGDILDLQRLAFPPDFTVTALTVCHVAPIPRVRLDELLAGYPRLAQGFWRLAMLEAATQRAWMMGMGRRTAYARVAHLFCEVFLRLRQAGLAQANRCRFPVTQSHLADAVGLSGVHLNRVLQSLRSDGLIAFRARELVVQDWAGLVAAGEFDASYLHLPPLAQVPPPKLISRTAPPVG